MRMRFTRLLFPACLVVTAGFGQNQVPPVPSDPLELATGPVQIADTADKRAAILTLLERARQNDNLHAPAGAPFDLKVSFVSSGQSLYNGPGEMEEVWLAPGTWRWTAHLGDYSQSRIYHNGAAYDTNAHAYLPLRLQMVRSAIFWPVSGNFADLLIRTADANWKGTPVTCALVSGTRSEVTTTPGRRWQEEEFCVDPKSGLLQTYSVAPGIYNVYDYSNAFQFHGSTIARQISILENGSPVVQVQLEGLQDAGPVDPASFTSHGRDARSRIRDPRTAAFPAIRIKWSDDVREPSSPSLCMPSWMSPARCSKQNRSRSPTPHSVTRRCNWCGPATTALRRDGEECRFNARSSSTYSFSPRHPRIERFEQLASCH